MRSVRSDTRGGMVTDSADYSKETPEDGNAERAGDPSSVLVVGAGSL
jgi:hypothetical protein